MLDLSTRYQIQREARLAALDTSAARAYKATDAGPTPGSGNPKSVIAYLYQPGNVLPLEQLRTFDKFQAPGMVKIASYGVAGREGDRKELLHGCVALLLMWGLGPTVSRSPVASGRGGCAACSQRSRQGSRSIPVDACRYRSRER